jgi:hypothetical protein
MTRSRRKHTGSSRRLLGLAVLTLLLLATDLLLRDVSLRPPIESVLEGVPSRGAHDQQGESRSRPLISRNARPGVSNVPSFRGEPTAPELAAGTGHVRTPGAQFNGFKALRERVPHEVDVRPRCVLEALPVEVRTPEFQVSWRAAGAVGEVESYTILVSTDDGPFALFLDRTIDTTANFVGMFGHSYGFLCMATDLGGTLETKRHVAEATTMVRRAVVRDIDGDGKADMLWRHSSGALDVWFMNGVRIDSTGSAGSVTADWIVQGIDDFDGDEKADVLWRNSAGHLAIWFMDGSVITDIGFPGGVGTDWTIQRVGDLNADGRADILWRHSSGLVGIWLMDGVSKRSVGFRGGVSADWTIEALGDFDGDGKADILWRHALGAVSIWLMDGVRMRRPGFPGVADTDWTIQGVGDFNGDGRSDILWKHSSGLIGVWLIDGTRRVRDSFPTGVGTDWTMQDTVDVDGDGNVDVVWRHASGAIHIWLMDGAQIRRVGSHSGVGLEWTMQ